MNSAILWSIAATGFVIAFSHAAIPTHWLPFVMAGRGQRWGTKKTLLVVALCGAGHVLLTTLLGILVVWLGIETSKWTGSIFPWIAGGALILFGLYYLVRQARGDGHGHGHHGHHGHSHESPPGEHMQAPGVQAASNTKTAKSDRAVILGLLTLLTFSPCEGFLPVYLSGISYGWAGFAILTVVLAAATIAGMMIFTGLMLSGIERIPLGFLEHYESGILGALIVFLGVGIIFLGL